MKRESFNRKGPTKREAGRGQWRGMLKKKIEKKGKLRGSSLRKKCGGRRCGEAIRKEFVEKKPGRGKSERGNIQGNTPREAVRGKWSGRGNTKRENQGKLI